MAGISQKLGPDFTECNAITKNELSINIQLKERIGYDAKFDFLHFNRKIRERYKKEFGDTNPNPKL